jgi:anti-sigma B factor antagonist
VQDQRIPPRDPLELRVSEHPAGARVALAGDLDLATAPMLSEALERVERGEPDVIVLDLREVTFMDSTGMSILLEAGKRAGEAGWELQIIRGSNQVDRLIAETGVEEFLTFVEEGEALA